MIELLIPILIAILFHFFVATLIWLGDIWEREPFREVVVRIIWGGIPAVIFVVIINFFLDPRPSTAGIIASAAIEELAKGLGIIFVFSNRYPFKNARYSTESETDLRNILALLSFRSLRSESQGERELDTPLDGLIYGAMVGLGFSLMEDIMYYGTFIGSAGDLMTFVGQRSVLLVLGHACYSGIVGLGIAIGKNQKGIMRTFYPIYGFVWATGFHALYNLSISSGQGKTPLIYIFSATAFIGLYIIYIQLEKKWIYEELIEELDPNQLTSIQIDYVISPRFRRKADWKSTIKKDPSWRKVNKFLQLCSELGLKKHQYKGLEFNQFKSSEITKLQKEVYRLSRMIGDDLETIT